MSEGAGLERHVVVRASCAGVCELADVVRAALTGGRDVVLVLSGPGPVDIGLVDVLARCALAARRSPGRLRVSAGTSGAARLTELRALAELTGLGEALLASDESGEALLASDESGEALLASDESGEALLAPEESGEALG